ncbi:MAG: response regulator transcription factor [Candidatus Riflebacteria bacterium]|nr:response regulator transcription factor [Candidatus Riflebacteria bacterium]
MEKKNAVIVDDEYLAREGLKTLLLGYPEISIIAEFSRFDEIRKFLENNSPDVIFLDIQLFGRNAFDLLPFIPEKTNVIFITAYDSYAVRAFEINALDYLLKPINRDRLALALKRLFEKTSEKPKQSKISNLTPEDGILLSISGRQKLVKISSIVAITSNGEYSEVHPFQSETGLVRKALKNWENELPKNKFIRIHRNTIVNLEMIKKVQKLEDGRCKIQLNGIPITFETSRRMNPEFEKAHEITEEA